MLTTLMGLVMEEAAMELILIIIVMEQLITPVVEPLEMVKIIKIKVTIMTIKMEHINQQLVVSHVIMRQSSKILNIKHNNLMEMLVKNMDKVRCVAKSIFIVLIYSFFIIS